MGRFETGQFAAKDSGFGRSVDAPNPCPPVCPPVCFTGGAAGETMAASRSGFGQGMAEFAEDAFQTSRHLESSLEDCRLNLRLAGLHAGLSRGALADSEASNRITVAIEKSPA